MPRPLTKTAATSLKMTPVIRDLWERCAEAENRSLANMFEVMVLERAKKLNIEPAVGPKRRPALKQTKTVKN